MSGRILSERRGAQGWILVDRPEKRGALTLPMWRDLLAAIESLAAAGVRVLVLAGTEGYFVAGADILEFEETKADPAAARVSFTAVDGVCRALMEIDIPVVAAVDGAAVGAGLEVLVSCDLRLCTGRARMGITAAKLGITIGRGHIARLVAAVGPARAKELLLTARLIGAAQAQAIGLVHEVLPDGETLLARAESLAEELAALAPGSHAWAKRIVREVAVDPALAVVADDAGEAIRCFETADFREALVAFRERRKPRFGDSPAVDVPREE